MRERHIHRLSPTHSLTEIEPVTLVSALTGNQTCDPWGKMLQPTEPQLARALLFLILILCEVDIRIGNFTNTQFLSILA